MLIIVNIILKLSDVVITKNANVVVTTNVHVSRSMVGPSVCQEGILQISN
jgi:hypothetical protein